MTASDIPRRSAALVGDHPGTDDWVRRTAARAMLRAVDFDDKDFEKPIVTVAVTYTNATPCNAHMNEIGDIVKEEVLKNGGKPFIFGTPVMSDGTNFLLFVLSWFMVTVLSWIKRWQTNLYALICMFR